MHVPAGCQLRPRNTGWFAAIDSLAEPQSQQVTYGKGGWRFAGATFDASAIYRLNAVMDLYQTLGLDIPTSYQYVRRLQGYFLEELGSSPIDQLTAKRLVYATGRTHGHFLTFELDSPETTAAWAHSLARKAIQVDYRGNRLRFGLGLYHDRGDIDALFARLTAG